MGNDQTGRDVISRDILNSIQRNIRQYNHRAFMSLANYIRTLSDLIQRGRLIVYSIS